MNPHTVSSRSHRLVAAVFAFGFATQMVAQDGPKTLPEWIWDQEAGADEELHFRGRVNIDGPVARARLAATCDNRMRVWVNGARVLASTDWSEPRSVDVKEHLVDGENVITAWGKNDGGPAAFVALLSLEFGGGEKRTFGTDRSWRVTPKATGNWRKRGFDDSAWPRVASFGTLGDPSLPWSGAVNPETLGTEPPPITGQRARRVKRLGTLDGFAAELVYDVPRPLGSWVSLTTDPQGRLYASDQGSGLYRITPAALGNAEAETTVERVDVDIGGAQGLLWAFDSLYVVVNGRGSGLYRLRDTDGDDQLDQVEKLTALRGAGEHGPHAVVLAPDGESLYVCAGNHTRLPEIAGSRLPPIWGEDLLLPRQWDARGHARGILAPGGWVCEVDPDGKNWVVVSSGYRNEYDIAFNADGELFAYDSDMEWDMGAPWYRPTRLCHAASGSEFGWRSGSGKWPVYFPDSLPAAVDIGPGSPTGIVFGMGAKFPAAYQRALYILDWTFGTIYAVHLTPDGASYTGRTEEFVTGKPLAVTDATVGHDGAMYFAVGGRGGKSKLYRVLYTGEASTAAVDGHDSKGEKDRALRRRLEGFHGRRDPQAVAAAWPHLSHGDRFIRYAARVAIESQPLDEWQGRALTETDPQASIEALIALARHGGPELQIPLLQKLGRLEGRTLTEPQVLAALRALSLAFVRMGKPDAEVRGEIIASLDPFFPSPSDDVNAELVRVMAYLEAPSVIEKTLALMAGAKPTPAPAWASLIRRNDSYGGPIAKMLANMPPLRNIYLAFLLRNVRYGWTVGQRREYFAFFNGAAKHPGGNSYAGFLKNIRADALKQCSEAERRAVADLTGEELGAATPIEIVPPSGPGRSWTRAEVLATVQTGMTGRDFARGRNLFHGVACAVCHRFDGEGGDIGPDLTTVRNKFGWEDLVDAIVEPSKAISDQYSSSIVTTKAGERVFGRVVVRDDGSLDVYSIDPEAPATRIARVDIAAIEPSDVSQMPLGLVNTLNPDELRDLLAYLMSRGDPADPAFKQ